jgi:hypothetical protein
MLKLNGIITVSIDEGLNSDISDKIEILRRFASSE